MCLLYVVGTVNHTSLNISTHVYIFCFKREETAELAWPRQSYKLKTMKTNKMEQNLLRKTGKQGITPLREALFTYEQRPPWRRYAPGRAGRLGYCRPLTEP